MRRSLARRGEGRVGGSLRDPGGVGVEDGGEFVRGWRAGVFMGRQRKNMRLRDCCLLSSQIELKPSTGVCFDSSFCL